MASSGPRRGGIIEGINVTPLVDITLVLLVIFIVTAKIVVTPAVPLDLPRATGAEELQTVLSVVVPREGEMSVDGEPITLDALVVHARTVLAEHPDARAVISADQAVSHGRVIAILDALSEGGLTHVAFGALRPGVPSASVRPPVEGTVSREDAPRGAIP
ncbi:MAG: biopolymer transporter ExbD [Sandaracinaceae bacterium]|nr:biopolymer transporter ExbD [Sandaracinaceae bacterium]MBP7684128.1 biopolymer transporter ExbD [Deltaproteobacteria bacterium]